MKRKILCLLIALIAVLVCALCFVGCGSAKPSSSNRNPTIITPGDDPNNGNDDPGGGTTDEEKTYRTVLFNPNGGSCSMENGRFEVGAVMQSLPTPTMQGYRFLGWYSNSQLYDTTSVMPNRDLSLTARWEKIVSTYSDNYVSLKPATSGVKSNNHRYSGVDQCVYVEIKSSDLNGRVGAENNFTLRTLTGMEYSVKEGYTWTWYYDNTFSNVNGAQRFSLDYGHNLQFVTVNNSSGVTVRTYLVNIYVLHDYYVNLYSTIYDANPYTRVRVIENERFSETTATSSLGNFEFDKRVYYNENMGEYVEFNYSTAITKDWNLYQTYLPVTMRVDLGGGALEGGNEVTLTPYTPYEILPVPQKNGYDFLGWKIGDSYYANILGYAGTNYITSTTASSTLTAVFEEKKYCFSCNSDSIKTYNTVPVVTYSDKTMSEILEVLYIPYNTDCALPTKTPQNVDEVFYEWSVFSKGNAGKFAKILTPFDFNTQVTEPIALVAKSVPSEHVGTTVALNRDVTFNSTGTYVVYLPTASRYVLNVTTNGNVAFTVNAYGSTSEHSYTASSTSPASVNLDYYRYNLGAAERSNGYVTFNVTSRSDSFTVKVLGKTGETDGEPIATNDDNLIACGDTFTVELEKPGYAFVGLFNGETEVTNVEMNGLIAELVMTIDTISYDAEWVNVSTSVNDDDCGSASILDETYIVGQEITINAIDKQRLGYIWLGWYKNGEIVSSDLSYTFNILAEDSEYVGTWSIASELQNFVFTSSKTELTITSIKDTTVTTIVMPNYVTSISEGALSGCGNLTNIVLPFVGGSATATTASDNTLFGYIFGTSSYVGGTSTIQYYSNNYYSTFYIPTSLNSVTITGGPIWSNAFYGCGNLTSVTIPNSVTSIGDYAFRGCSNLTSIEIPNSVTSIGSMAFNICSSLIIYCEAAGKPYGWDSDWNGECPVVWSCKNNDKDTNGYAYTVIDGIRYNLKDGIATVGQPINNISGAIIIPSSVTYESSVIYENEDYNVMSIKEYAFRGCSNLTSIEIPNSVTSIGSSAFYGCSSLTCIEIPNSVTSIGSSAFLGCSSLTSIEIPSSVTSIGSKAFNGCSSLLSITAQSGNTKYHSTGNCLIETASKTLIAGCKNSVIPTDGSVTSIGDYAFSGCSSLTSITIPNSVTSIEWYAFSGCSSLTSVTIPNSVTSIGNWAFHDCRGLTRIVFIGKASQWDSISKGYGWNYSTGNYKISYIDETIE